MRESRVRRPRFAAALALAAAMIVPSGAQAATADLRVAKADSPDPVARDAVLTYTITVFNLGPDAVSGVRLNDKLPNHADFISAIPSQGMCDRDGRRVRCELGTLAVDPYAAVATVTIQVRPTKVGQLVNTATVEVAKADSDPAAANNSASLTTTVVAPGGAPGPTCAGRAATIVGTAGAETLVGTAKRDVILARGGNDTVRGLGGKDIVCAAGGNDRVKGGAGNDRLKGGSGKDTLRGGGGADELRGGGGRDRLFGGPGRDRLRGGGGRDRLFGGPGRDRLRGGGGADSCAGGAGSDTRRGC